MASAQQILLHSDNGNALVMAAAQHLIRALKASETKLQKRVQNVEIENITFPETGEQFKLTLTRLSDGPPIGGVTQASGGVQSGGSSASPGAVPAATTGNITSGTVAKALRNTRTHAKRGK